MIGIEDMKWLSQYEMNFKTAINSNYSRNVSDKVLRRMKEIYDKETGKNYNLCFYCPSSILGFLKDCGKLYFSEVQEGTESVLVDNKLEKTVTDMEVNNTKKGTSNNTKKKKK